MKSFLFFFFQRYPPDPVYDALSDLMFGFHAKRDYGRWCVADRQLESSRRTGSRLVLYSD